MPFTVTETDLPGVLILEPKVFGDERGFFYESFNARDFKEATGVDTTFVQDNHSRSAKGVLRGLHYQIKHPQGKLVRVTEGEVFDVAVDLRKSSQHFGKWTAVTLSAANRRQLWIPPGFAHGFLVTSHSADFIYKTTTYWDRNDECCVLWSDQNISVNWPQTTNLILADKDKFGTGLMEVTHID